MPRRTLRIPIAEVLEGGTKQEFYAALRSALRISTQIANLSVTECVRQDDITSKKCGRLYTYPGIKHHAPGMASAVATISRQVEKSYRNERFNVLRGARSLRLYRQFPFPLTVGSKELRLDTTGESIVAKIRIGSWWTVRLAGGTSHRFANQGIKRALSLGAIKDSSIAINSKNHATLYVSCDFPMQESRVLKGTMNVCSHRDHLLCCTFDLTDVPFVINADMVHKWKSESNRRHQRFRQDRKSGANRRNIMEQQKIVAERSNRRFQTLCHEVSSHVVSKARRMGIATIKLDFTIKAYAREFPWHMLKEKICYKADELGISVVDATQNIAEPDVSKPHVYFKLAPSANRVKIGRTSREDGGRHGAETDSAEDLIIIAIDNQPKTRLVSREKHFHALFQEYRVKGEWFHAEPVIAYLRDVGWFGNAGNLSQIMQT